MAQNTALKYSSKVDERLSLKEMTNIGLNTDYDWTDVDKIRVYSIDTAPLHDYKKAGTNRYGTPTELDDTYKEYALTTDKSYTFTIDKWFKTSQAKAKATGKALAREIDEEVAPFKDLQRLLVWTKTAIANNQFVTATLSKSNTYEKLLELQKILTNNKTPRNNRIVYAKPGVINFLKLDPSFIKQGDISQKMLIKGQVGKADGLPIIEVPDMYFPEGTDMILVYTKSTLSPSKLAEHKVHKDPPGLSGDLVEGRFALDTFVLKNKEKCVVAIGAAVPTHYKTLDSEYKENKTYYSKSGTTYTALTAGTDYTAGDNITSEVYEAY